MREAGDPTIPVVERPSARDQRHDAPERSRVPLQLGDTRREVRAERAEARPGAARRQVTDERFDEVDDRAPDVVLGEERVARHGVRPRAGRHARHAILSEVLGAHLVNEAFAGEEPANLGHREVAHA